MTRNNKFILQDVSAEKIINFAEAVAHGLSDIKAIADFIGVGVAQAKKIQSMSTQMGIIKIEVNKFSLVKEKDEKIFINASAEASKTLFLGYLTDYEPFSKFYHFLSIGYVPEIAARRTAALYSITRPPKSVLKMLKSWGVYGGVLSPEGGILIENKLQNESIDKIDELRKAFENKLTAKEYLLQTLGEEMFDALEYNLKEEIIKSMINFAIDPRGAIKIAREVLEDYLTYYGGVVGVDMSQEGTLNQKTIKLRQSKKIAKKHVPILEGLEVMMEEGVMQNIGAFGNLVHHSKIDEEMTRWSVSGEIALVIVLQAILTIKSIYLFGVKGQTEY